MKTKPFDPKQTVRSTICVKLTVAAGVLILPIVSALAEPHTAGTPQLSSQPGAAYSLYLDFAGFNYTGDWGGKTPGSSLAYADVPANGTFNAQQIADIRAVWAGVAQQFAAFNINVTTIDPATGANAATDAARQIFYANTPNFMHTIITNQDRGGTDWFGPGVAGISFESTTNGTESNSGGHTAWVFSAGALYSEVGNARFMSQGAVHENGHGLGLSHQSDYIGNTLVNDYGIGDKHRRRPHDDPRLLRRDHGRWE